MARATDAQKYTLIGRYFGTNFRTYNGKTYYEMSILQPSSQSLANYSISESLYNRVEAAKMSLQAQLACEVEISNQSYNGNTRARREILNFQPLEDWLKDISVTSPEDYE